MSILERTQEDLERRLRDRLALIRDTETLSILQDIDEVKRIKGIVANASPSSAIKVIARIEPNSVRNGNIPAGLTQGDAAVEIIRKAGKPLHINEILTQMQEYGFTTTKVNLNSILVKDRKERFVNKGQATFDLNPNGRSAGLKSNADFSLTESIKALIPELHGEFSQPVIYDILTKRYPRAAKSIQKPSISTTLKKFVKRGLIEVTYPGFGPEPRRYKRKDIG